MANSKVYSKIIYDGRVLIDLTGDTVNAASLRQGYTAHGADGKAITGTYTADSNDEIDRILTCGLTAGNITSTKGLSGYTLLKTISDDGKTITTVQKDSDGNEIGRTVKTYVDGENVIEMTDPQGRIWRKTIDPENGDTVVLFLAADGKQLGKMESVHSEDGKTMTINVVYGS